MSKAIITGGGVRLGREMALHLAESGWDILLHYNTSSRAAETVKEEIEKKGRTCALFRQDLLKTDQIPAFLAEVVSGFPDVELLINSASIFPEATIQDTDIETLDSIFRINLMAPFLLMKEYRRQVNRGQIINILDQRISKNLSAHAAYTLSKSPNSHLTKIGAVEFGPEIRVNAIAPGMILPPSGRDMSSLQKQSQLIPARRVGSVSALLKALDYLLEADFVTGDTLFIDGGESKSR